MKKVGIIRCQQTEDICPGTTDFKVAPMGELGFESIGFVSCGGCPGKRAVSRVKMMIDRGAEAIAFASCVSLGKPMSMVCPHFELMKEAVAKKLGPEIPLLDYTH